MGFSDDLRMRVKDKANFACCWCRDQDQKVEIHHIIPQAEGGSDTEENAAPLCSNCHTKYGENPDMRKEIKARRNNWYKLCGKEHVLVSQSDIQAILQHIITGSSEAATEPQNKQPKDSSDWKPLYQLKLPVQPVEPAGSQALAGWRFVYNSPDPRIALYTGAILGIGATDNSIASRSPVGKILNCRVSCDICIAEYGTEPSNWAGFRLRGIYDNLTLGYLAFLRADGRFDIHRVDEIIASVAAVENAHEVWTNIQLDIHDSKIEVSINGVQKISLIDKWFGGLGDVYIHTFGTHSLFRNFQVYALEGN